MNNRIKELGDQAEHSVKWGDPNNYDDYHRAMDEWQEKFAELIVRECMDICEQQRLKILNNPDDPSWTEHLAECQINMDATFLRS